MIYTINANEHKSSPRKIRLWRGKSRTFSYRVKFGEECLQNYGKNLDTNKLLGVSTHLWPFKQNGKWHPGHHKSSIRIGWLASNLNPGKILLSGYNRNDLSITIDEMGYIYPEQWYCMSIRLTKCEKVVRYTIYVTPELNEDRTLSEIELVNNKISFESSGWLDDVTGLWYPLGFYFGGDLPAPINMNVEIV